MKAVERELLNFLVEKKITRPDPAWVERVRAAVFAFGAEEFDGLARRVVSDDPIGPAERTLRDRVIWIALALARKPETVRAFVEVCERGSRSGQSHPDVAVAVVRGLGVADASLALPELERLRARVRHRTLAKEIGLALDAQARARGVTRDELEDSSVPDHGLRNGERTFATARVSLKEGRVAIEWRDAGGKIRKTPPKDGDASEAKTAARALRETVSAQRGRLEEATVDERAWPIERFLEVARHPVLGDLLSRVVLRCGDATAIVRGGKLEDVGGAEVAATTVSIAHPASLPDAELDRWRARFQALAIAQPWKQLWREVYRPAAEERAAARTDRFQGQLVPHAKLYALAKQRGWSGFACVADGTWEGSRAIHGLHAHLTVAPESDAWFGPARRVALGSLCFERRERGRVREVVPLGEVPPVAFSEAMRDVDLVAGVGAIGRAGDERLLVATAAARADVVERLLPALGLGDRVRLDGRHAIVRGDLNTYRIHLGSGNVHVHPDGRFISIAPLRRERTFWLPDEEEVDPRTAEVLELIRTLARDVLVEDEALARELTGERA